MKRFEGMKDKEIGTERGLDPWGVLYCKTEGNMRRGLKEAALGLRLGVEVANARPVPR